jgi:argininosuccinate synthase
VAHGATGKGNDQVRFELAFAALGPELEVIAPWRLENFREKFPGRTEMIDYARDHNIPVQASASKPYSMDRNLLHISYESGVLEDTWFDASSPANKDMFLLTNSPEDAPDQPEYVELLWEKGNCIGLKCASLDETLRQVGYQGDLESICDGEGISHLSPLWIMLALNKLAGKHGVGRIDMVENRFVGMKSRGVYETPAGTILFHAHRDMESITMDREVMHLRDSLISRYSTLVYNGFWFAPERACLQALVTESQRNVSGITRVKLYKGNVISAGRKSAKSLYDPDVATMEDDPTHAYNQDDATGFIRLNSLRLRVAAKGETGLGTAGDWPRGVLENEPG